MKFFFNLKLSTSEKYKRSKKMWPLYVLGVVVFYWKLNFWLASILTIILSTWTAIEIYFLKKNNNNNENGKFEF